MREPVGGRLFGEIARHLHVTLNITVHKVAIEHPSAGNDMQNRSTIHLGLWL